MTNRPVDFSDPTGHRPCGDGEEYDCDGRTQDPDANPYPHKSRHEGRDLSLLLGLKPNTCTDNACTLPPLVITGGVGSEPSCSPSAYLLSEINCQFSWGLWKKIILDVGGYYVKVYADASTTFIKPDGSTVTLSNDGLRTVGFEWFIDSFQVRNFSLSANLGNVGSATYTWGTGVDFDNMSVMTYAEVEYSLQSEYLSADGTVHMESGARPIIAALEVISIYIFSRAVIMQRNPYPSSPVLNPVY